MKKIFVFRIMIILCLTAIGQRNVLFVGNSLTFYNDMPTMFENLANTKGQNVAVTQYTIGGAGLHDMQSNADLLNLFNQPWDFVILQPGTSESGGMGVGVDSLTAIVKTMCRRIWNVSPCAKICLFEISNGIYFQDNTPMWDYYFTTQPLIRNVIHKVAEAAKLPYAPVGECFVAYYQGRNDLQLHNDFNDVHPNTNGSYLTTLVMYNTLFEESNICSYYGNTEEGLAKILQHISDSVVLNHKDLWLLDEFKTNVDFSYAIHDDVVRFVNLSTNYETIEWNINDEFTSYDNEFDYQFSSAGEKFAAVNIDNHGCKYNLTKEFEITKNNSIDEKEFCNDIIFTNNSIVVNTTGRKEIYFRVSNMLGQIVKQGKTNNNVIDICDIARDTYIITFIVDNKQYCYRFIK